MFSVKGCFMQTETNQEVQLNSNKNSVATFAIVLLLFMAAVDGTIDIESVSSIFSSKT